MEQALWLHTHLAINRKPFLAVRESVLILGSSENRGAPEVESQRSVHEAVVRRAG